MFPPPGDLLLAPQPQQQVQLLREDLSRVLEVLTEVGVRSRDDPAPDDELDPAAGEQVDSRVVFGDPKRIQVREQRDTRAEPQRGGAFGDRAEPHGWSREDVVAEVVLSEPDR